jgi:hypothetical protein
LNEIPLRIHTAFSPSIHPSIHPLISYLAYYEECCNKHVSADVSDILISVPLAIYPEVGLVDHMVVLFLVFF